MCYIYNRTTLDRIMVKITNKMCMKRARPGNYRLMTDLKKPFQLSCGTVKGGSRTEQIHLSLTRARLFILLLNCYLVIYIYVCIFVVVFFMIQMKFFNHADFMLTTQHSHVTWSLHRNCTGLTRLRFRRIITNNSMLLQRKVVGCVWLQPWTKAAQPVRLATIIIGFHKKKRKKNKQKIVLLIKHSHTFPCNS